MSNLSDEELAALLEDSKMQVVVGGMYKHYKGNLYKVLNVALQESDLKPVVVYQAQYGTQAIFVRPIAVWNEKLEHDGRIVSRFQLVEEVQ